MTSTRTKALALSYFTVGYNLLEAAVAIIASSLSGSTALWGFGLDSIVESLSGAVMIWRFSKYDLDADEEEFEAVEKQASRLVAYTFFALGAYVAVDAGRSLYWQKAPEPSTLGIALAVASLVVMPLLFFLKYRLGQSIGSRSLVADSKETLACVLLSAALLFGLGSHYIWRVWWADSAAALVIAGLILREGYETLEESRNQS
jgi:divalent metal cation (Fe/Co/Zn/Cd) transporter